MKTRKKRILRQKRNQNLKQKVKAKARKKLIIKRKRKEKIENKENIVNISFNRI